MNKLFLPLISGIFFPALISYADLTGLNGTAIDLQPIIVKKQDLQNLPADLNKDNDNLLKVEVKTPPKKAFWKKEIERWYTEEAQGSSMPVRSALGSNDIEHQRAYEEFLSSVSPRYRVNKNFLSLTQVPTQRVKDAFTFIFLMNNPHYKYKNQPQEGYQRMRMHILWTGPKKMLTEQKFIKNEYPIDVSIADYKDGYAEGEWNLVLPSKKPREVKVSLMWSF